MKRIAATILSSSTTDATLLQGRRIIRHEADALQRIAEALDESFYQAVELILSCEGSVIVCGMGKAGLVGQKIAATFASTGTRSHFLHPAEARHGDLGRIHPTDVMLVLSNSGRTDEIVQLLPALDDLCVSTIAVTQHRDNPLGKYANIVLPLGPLDEADAMKLAPSTSTTAMMAIGDALALVASERRGFQPRDFARFHPGGSLGRKLGRVESVMRPLSECRLANENQTVREVLVAVGRPGRRTGAIMLTDSEGHLTGIFTDSDLARIFESRRDDQLDQPIRQVMNANPTRIQVHAMTKDAVDLLARRKISELPVVDEQIRPQGLIDITDVVGWQTQPSNEMSKAGDADRDTDQGPATIPFRPPQSHSGPN